MKKERILVVDDDPNILEVLAMRLESKGFDAVKAESAESALDQMTGQPFDLVLTDLRMSGLGGMDLLEQVHEKHTETPVIILTAHGTIPNAVEAMQKGAFSYLTKPFEDRELSIHIARALEKRNLTRKIHNLETLVEDRFSFKNIVGKGQAMQAIFEQISQVSPTDSTILLTGESGTGKELFARAIHARSHRAAGPFIAVNCGAIPENLLENELFGHAKGAYTGAHASQEGFFSRADGGTIFLDEIGETPLSIQVKLLRVLQEKEFDPIGSQRSVKVDVRVLAATNQKLAKAVQAGSFREDLYYRIQVIPIHIPSLRERKEDIPFLIDHFIRKYARIMNRDVYGIDPNVVQFLMQRDWPGNVRELENRIEQAMVMAQGTTLGQSDFVLLQQKPEQSDFMTFKQAKNAVEKQYVTHLLKLTGGHITNAAQLAGKQRADLYNLMKKHKIQRNDFRDT